MHTPARRVLTTVVAFVIGFAGVAGGLWWFQPSEFDAMDELGRRALADDRPTGAAYEAVVVVWQGTDYLEASHSGDDIVVFTDGTCSMPNGIVYSASGNPGAGYSEADRLADHWFVGGECFGGGDL